MNKDKSLYKMILVDDEDEIRGRISSKISKESGFEVIGTAGNGYDAIELIEKHSPHIVITDIKMPYIDGIELARIIKRDFPIVRIAFITGYDEFDYAREAIELKASSFLTKPVTKNDISHFLTTLKEELDQEFKEKYNREFLENHYQQSLPLIIDNYFTSFLVSGDGKHDSDIDNLKTYGIDLNDKSFLTAFIHIEKDDSFADIIEFEKLRFSLRSALLSILERHQYEFYSFLFNKGIVLIIKEKGKLFLKDIDPIFYEMIRMADRYLNVKINIGVSTLNRSFRGLFPAYEESVRALAESQFLNRGRIIYIDQIESLGTTKPNTLSLSEADVKNIDYNIRFGSDSDVRNTVESLKLNALRDSKGGGSFEVYIINMVNIIVNFSHSVGVDINEVIGDDILRKMLQFNSLEQIFDWALSILLKLREKNLSTKMTNSQRLLDNAVKYIEKNYWDSHLSMELVCDELNISISYLSLLFKKEKSTTFVKYLTKVRIERAQEFLKLTADRIIDIAAKCGYNEVYYFSHSFKKFTGVSPKKYREENKA